MAIENLSLPSGIWRWTICAGMTAAIGCGSSTPPPPPNQTPAMTNMPAMTPTPPSAPAGPTDPAAAMASTHGSTPASGPTASPTMPGMPGTAHNSAGPTAPATPATMPTNSHAAGPTAPPASGPTDPAAAMRATHAQSANTTTPPGSVPGSGPVDPMAQMKAHAQAANTTTPAQPGAAPGHAQNTPMPGAPMPGAPMPGAPMPGAPGAIPGGPGAVPGNPGAGPGAGGQGGQQQFAVGSAEDSLSKFCLAMADSNLTDAAQYISPKAKGMLQQIREGTIPDDKLEGLKASFAPQGLSLRPTRPVGGGRTINLANSKNELLSFTLFKEDDSYRIRDFSIKKAPR